MKNLGSVHDGCNKSEETQIQNMHSLYTVVMSLCDSIIEDKVKAHEDYPEIKCTRNTIKLLQVMKQYMYSNGSEALHSEPKRTERRKR